MAKKNKYDDIDLLLNDIESDIESVLTDEVLDTVKDIEIKHVEEDVFSIYRPKIYERRGHGNGGLDDPDNIVGEITGKMDMEITNITPFNSGYGTYNKGDGLAELVNDGEGFSGHYYDYDGEFTQPRPFLDNTEEEILKTEQLDNALQKGLIKRGYDVR